MCQRSHNYAFCLRAALASVTSSAPRVLDFGCGTAGLVALAREAGLDAWGVDTYGNDEGDFQRVSAQLLPYVRRIDGGRVPFPDGMFNVVVANMVFEHVAPQQVPGVLAEIRRVLEPGGVLVAAFPVHETWFEGHLRLYFPHWLGRWPRAQRAYLAVCHQIGAGRARLSDQTSDIWAREKQAEFGRSTFLHRRVEILALMERELGSQAEHLADDYIRFQLRQRRRLRWMARVVPSMPLRALCAIRAGLVLRILRS